MSFVNIYSKQFKKNEIIGDLETIVQATGNYLVVAGGDLNTGSKEQGRVIFDWFNLKYFNLIAPPNKTFRNISKLDYFFASLSCTEIVKCETSDSENCHKAITWSAMLDTPVIIGEPKTHRNFNINWKEYMSIVENLSFTSVPTNRNISNNEIDQWVENITKITAKAINTLAPLKPRPKYGMKYPYNIDRWFSERRRLVKQLQSARRDIFVDFNRINFIKS